MQDDDYCVVPSACMMLVGRKRGRPTLLRKAETRKKKRRERKVPAGKQCCSVKLLSLRFRSFAWAQKLNEGNVHQSTKSISCSVNTRLRVIATCKVLKSLDTRPLRAPFNREAAHYIALLSSWLDECFCGLCTRRETFSARHVPLSTKPPDVSLLRKH